MNAGRWLAGLSLAGWCVSAFPADGPDPVGPLDSAISAAEERLRAGDLAAAEGRYREALFEGWLATAALEKLERRIPEARDALRNASLFRVESPQGLRALGTAQLQMGEAAAAGETFEALAAADTRDGEARRLLARALAAGSQLEAAQQKLAEAEALAGDDAELAFLVGTDYLWLKRVGDAERLFARVRKARPIPQTHVLIGRAYRDAGEYDRARAELQAALARDPAVRRAHYYLGMVILADARTGPERLVRAMAEFQEELKLAPDDAPANDQLGLALLEAGRPDEALPPLESAVRARARPLYLFHLGRCLLALDRPADAAAALRRALETAEEHAGSEDEIAKIHYQLGLALRKLGAGAEAAAHLAQAKDGLAGGQATDTGPADAAPVDVAGGLGDDASPLAEVPLAQRQGFKRRAAAGLVRAYFNLGVLQVQGHRSAPAAERFTRAAAFFERAAELDADFPQLQSSLGVAYFNAREFAKATGPLARAVAAAPDSSELLVLLAQAHAAQGEDEEAVRALEKALQIHPDDPEARRALDAVLEARRARGLEPRP